MANLRIRLATPDMVPELRRIDVLDWGEEAAASEETLLARIRAYPLGNFVAVDARTGTVLGSVWSVAIDPGTVTTWKSATGEGVYNNCNPLGEMGFGVNLSTRREAIGMGIGRTLIEHVVSLAFRCGRRYFRFGGRIPGYHEWSKGFSAEDYVHLYQANGQVLYHDPTTGLFSAGPALSEAKASESRYDPRVWPICGRDRIEGVRALDWELEFFLRLRPDNLVPQIFRVQADYFTDPVSHNYGVIMGWDNPDMTADE